MAQRSTGLPQGITDAHQRPHRGWRAHANPAATLVLGGLLVAALLGAFGVSTTLRTATDGACLEVHLPSRIRTGELFEIRIMVVPNRPVSQLRVGISTALVQDMTINTVAPQAAEEASAAGEERYVFGRLASAEVWMGKLDLQINPNLFGLRRGQITVYDGGRALASVDAGILVLP